MKSWANTYLVGAVWGTSLIVAAVVAFVALVSLQALHEWPISVPGGGDASNADQRGAIASEGKPATPNLNVGPSAGPSVAASGATDAPSDSTGASGKRRHDSGTRGGGTSRLANEAPVVSPASAEGPVARNPGSHSPAGAGAPLAAPPASPSETGDSSNPTVAAESAGPGRKGERPGSSPATPTTTAVPRNPGSSPPPASTATVPRNPDPGPPEASEARGRS